MREITKKQLQGRRTTIGAAAMALAWSGALWAVVASGGCAGPATGGRTYNVGVTSNVGGLRAYAVPHRDWLRNGKTDIYENTDKLEQFQLNGYTNPGGKGATRDLKKGRYIFLVQKQGQWERMDAQIEFRGRTEFNIEFPPESDG